MTHNDHDNEDLLPREPIDTLVDPLRQFLHIEAASGIVLLMATAVALTLANLPTAEWYLGLWKTRLTIGLGGFRMDYSLQHWINDGLMAIFFFVIGLEVKLELVMGELRDLRQAVLPIAAALGGMLVPAGIFILLQWDAPGQRGWGIPMATDIAFVVGCLAVLGKRIPGSLRILLLSLAIADDIGAILVIAIGYTESLNLMALVWGAVGIAVLPLLIRVGIRNQMIYYLLMVLTWLAFHESGIHATIAGVIFGLMMPTRSWVSDNRLAAILHKTRHFLIGDPPAGSEERYAVLRQMERAARKSISPLERHETELHPWVGFLIMPVFALANAGVPIQAAGILDPVALATAAGLFLGKPVGILLFSWLAVNLKLARLPAGVNWGAVIGGGFLAGIGFTMALFISGLALSGPMLDAAKVGVMTGSALSAVVGISLLIVFLPQPSETHS
jgi:NhaA family Na+:H+ antiporter